MRKIKRISHVQDKFSMLYESLSLSLSILYIFTDVAYTTIIMPIAIAIPL